MTPVRTAPRWWIHLMLLSLALTIGAPDHWLHDVVALGPANHEDETLPEVAYEHAQHCHGQTATCTDLPLTTGSGLAILAGWLAGLMLLDERLARHSPAALALTGQSPTVPTPPPRLLMLRA